MRLVFWTENSDAFLLILHLQVEYMIVKINHEKKRAQLSLRGKDILDVMDKREEHEGPTREVLWRPEFGAYMVEATPGHPYGEDYQRSTLLCNFQHIQKNMELRRKEA